VAREQYLEAMRLAASVVDHTGRLHELAEASGSLPLTEADRALLAAMTPAVAALQRAARQRNSWPPDGRPLDVMPSLIDLMQAVDALIVTVADRGRSDAGPGVQLLLDGVRAGVDMLGGATLVESMVGSVIIARCLQALDDGVLQALDAEQLARLGGALAMVDAALPARADSLPKACLDMVRGFGAQQPASPTILRLATQLRAWHYGFDEREWSRAQVAELVGVLVRHEATAPAADAAWPAVQQALERLQREADPLVADLGGGGRVVVQAERALRESTARVRLLRLAVAFQQRLPVPALRDPLGSGDLGHGVHGDEATFTSADAALQRTSQRAPR
jgi:hypothetical protein